jgi:hypothetical protein
MIIVSMQLIYCPAMSESIAAYLKPVYYFLNVYVKERTHMYILPYVFFLFFHILFLYNWAVFKICGIISGKYPFRKAKQHEQISRL